MKTFFVVFWMFLTNLFVALSVFTGAEGNSLKPAATVFLFGLAIISFFIFTAVFSVWMYENESNDRRPDNL